LKIFVTTSLVETIDVGEDHESTFQRTKQVDSFEKRQGGAHFRVTQSKPAHENETEQTRPRRNRHRLFLTVSLMWIGRVVHAQRGPEPQPPGVSATDRIAAGRYFPGRLVWVGGTPPSEDESQLLLEVLERWRLSRTAEGLAELDEFVLEGV
jgi:hypothetical protein